MSRNNLRVVTRTSIRNGEFVRKDLDTFPTPQPGQITKIRLDVGPVYDRIIFVTSMTAAELEEIKIEISGKEQIVVSGNDLVMLENYKIHMARVNYFLLPLADDTLEEENGRYMTSLVTEKNDNVILSVKVKSTAVNPTLRAYAETTGARSEGRVYVPRMYYDYIQIGQVGDNHWTGLKQDVRFTLKRLHFMGDVARLKIEHNGYAYHDLSFDDNRYLLERNMVREAQTMVGGGSIYHYDPLVTGRYKDAILTGLTPIKFTITTGTAMTSLPVLVEGIQQVKPLPR